MPTASSHIGSVDRGRFASSRAFSSCSCLCFFRSWSWCCRFAWWLTVVPPAAVPPVRRPDDGPGRGTIRRREKCGWSLPRRRRVVERRPGAWRFGTGGGDLDTNSARAYLPASRAETPPLVLPATEGTPDDRLPP